ncbi:hypothetical protein Tco_1456288 [Tanacetum coccineum]
MSNVDFPEHYFNFATYNELDARADVKNAILTGFIVNDFREDTGCFIITGGGNQDLQLSNGSLLRIHVEEDLKIASTILIEVIRVQPLLLWVDLVSYLGDHYHLVVSYLGQLRHLF